MKKATSHYPNDLSASRTLRRNAQLYNVVSFSLNKKLAVLDIGPEIILIVILNNLYHTIVLL